MMKKMIMRKLAWIMALAMACSGTALAEEAAVTEAPVAETAVEETAVQETAVEEAAAAEEEQDPVVVVFNGEEIHWSEITDMAEYLANAGYIESAQDYATAFNTVIQQLVLEYKIEQLGLDVFTEEEAAAFHADAQQQWDDAIDAYMAQFQTSENPTDEELATLRAQAEAYYNAYGYDVEVIAENVQNSAAYDRLEGYLAENSDVSVTDEEVEALYSSYVEEDRSYFENNVMMYEYYTQYMQYNVTYVPEGYRGVLQILLDVDQELLTAYQDKVSALQAQQAAAAAPDAGAAATDAPAEPVTQEDVDAARAAIIASRQDTIDEIYSRLDAGEAFIDLIPDYNVDPGMQVAEYLENGYQVAKDSIMYDDSFVAAAFDENMTEVGAVSAPSVGSYGIYIVYYLRDVPAGAVPMTDEMRESLRSNLESSKLNAAYNTLVPQWLDECDLVVYEDLLKSLGGLNVENGFASVQDEPAAAAE